MNWPALGESIAGDHIIPAGRGPAGEGGGGQTGKLGRKAGGLAGEGGRKQSRANTARAAELAQGLSSRDLPANSREILGPGVGGGNKEREGRSQPVGGFLRSLRRSLKLEWEVEAETWEVGGLTAGVRYFVVTRRVQWGFEVQRRLQGVFWRKESRPEKQLKEN